MYIKQVQLQQVASSKQIFIFSSSSVLHSSQREASNYEHFLECQYSLKAVLKYRFYKNASFMNEMRERHLYNDVFVEHVQL